VYLVEPRARRRELGLALGATATFDSSQADWQQALQAECNSIGPDVVFECAGARDTADTALHVARKGGCVVLVGIHPERVPFSTLELIVGEKRVVGSVQHHYDEDLPTALHLLAQGQVRVAPLITDRVALDRLVVDGLRALAEQPEEHLKIIVSPNL
jgi:threonine dehydrogenase-like Zn-dependent dehydrogenase